MNKKFSKIIPILFVIPILLNIIACNSKIIITDNISQDNKDPNEKDKDNKEPDKIKKDYDEKWNWNDNEKEILQFIKNFQVEVKEKWIELATENPILEDGKNLLTIIYKNEYFNQSEYFKNKCYELIDLWNKKSTNRYFGYKGLIQNRFLKTLTKKYNWILEIQEEGFMKDNKNILLFKNQWHRNITRKNIDNYWVDAIRFNFNFDETYTKTISGQKYYDNDNILCKARNNNNVLTLSEINIYRFFTLNYKNHFKIKNFILNDNLYLVDFYEA